MECTRPSSEDQGKGFRIPQNGVPTLCKERKDGHPVFERKDCLVRLPVRLTPFLLPRYYSALQVT